MKFPIVASLILFVIFLGIRISVVGKIEKASQNDFLKRELEANSTRKKSIDALPYIAIPFELLPIHTLIEDLSIQECFTQLSSFREKKIINLSMYSNTDLKLKYGAANITLLSEYDQNYTDLICLLEHWGELLYEKKQLADAITVLEYATSIQTDIAKSYQLLGQLYLENGQPEKITSLILLAENLSDSLQERIINNLKKLQVNQLL